MHREGLCGLLERYLSRFPEEREVVERTRRLVDAHEDCLLRSCQPGHITASAWIVSPDGERHLLTHHRKLGIWVQLGGHADGEARIEEAALREAREESGMQDFQLLHPGPEPVPLDLDVHPIPALGREPRHDHYDIRFLLRAGPGQQIRVSKESRALRWFSAAEVPGITGEESVLRMLRKAQRWLGEAAP